MDVDEIRRRLRAAGARLKRARRDEEAALEELSKLANLGRAAGLGPTEMASLAGVTRPTLYRRFSGQE